MELSILEACLHNVDSRYRAVLTTSRRAKQIQKGSSPLAKTRSPKAIAIAMTELAENKIGYTDQPEEEVDSDVYYAPRQKVVTSSEIADGKEPE